MTIFLDLIIFSKNGIQFEKVVIKTAPKERFENERDLLKRFCNCPHTRQLLDETRDPPSLVLRHLDDNLLDASNKLMLQSSDVKLVAKRILQALQALHEDGYTHTGMALGAPMFYSIRYLTITLVDIKPNNILVNYSSGHLRFDDVQLADFGDVSRIDPKDYLQVGLDGPLIGAAIFRSPEAMLQLRWGQSTDIWSFGATVSNDT